MTRYPAAVVFRSPGKTLTVSRPVLSSAVCLLLALHVVGGRPSPARGQSQRPRPADTVLVGGRIVTLDAQNRIASALAVAGQSIAAVGSDDAIAPYIGPRTRVIRLDGKTVIPGIIETHCHAIGVARASLQQPYAELSSIGQVQDWIRRRAAQLPAGQWIIVPRTDITRIKERRHPTPAELDAACSTHPVYFKAARKIVLNTMGLQTVGLDSPTARIPGGRILRDEAGRVAMIAGADSWLRQFLPPVPVTDEQLMGALVRVLRTYNRVGITSIFERATDLDGVMLYRKLRAQNLLTVRCTATIRQQLRDGEAVQQFSDKLGLRTGDGDDWVRIGPLKITVDGGIHWGNTYLSEPYGLRRARFYRLSDPNWRGELRYSVDQMEQVFAAGHRLGWQMGCHVTGDGGVDAVLDALQRVDRVLPLRDRRFTLIHCYFPSEAAARRAARLGVCVDTQPYLYYKDSDAIADVYGPDWARRFIGLGSWRRGGVVVAINSDHMIGLDPDHAMNSFNPFLQMYIAASRRNEQGRVYGAEQKISRLEALRAMTSSAAWLSFDEQRKGQLKPGMLADLAVLDRDFLHCPVEQIRQIKVLLTMVGGTVVYQRQ